MKKILLSLTVSLATSMAFAQANMGTKPAPAPQGLGAKLEKAMISVKAYVDFTNDNADLPNAKTFHMDRDFIRAHTVDFTQLFMDDSATLCYRGNANEVLKIVSDIMMKSHADGNFILARDTKITPDTITQSVNLTDDGGPHDINILLKRCK